MAKLKHRQPTSFNNYCHSDAGAGVSGIPTQDLQAQVLSICCNICLFCSAKRKQTAPASIHICFPFGGEPQKNIQ